MVVGPTGTVLEEPIPVPEEEPRVRAASPAQWVTQNLFNTWYNAALTVVFAAMLAWVTFKVARFVFITGRWEIIRVNLTTAMLGPFPRGELYRVWIAVFLIAAIVGVSVGVSRWAAEGRWSTARRAIPLLALVVVLLAFARTRTPLLLTLGAVAVAAGGWMVGRRLPNGTVRRLPLVWLVTAIGAYAALTAYGGVGWDLWGGLFLTLSLAVGGIVLSFPLGVLLALGRRSSLPAVRVICTAYIELIRGVPLVTILFIGATVGFLLPSHLKPSLVTRALVALIAFTAAYLAEIVRGGLQGVPRGQIEAAQALGLSPLRTTFLIVLPQALQNVVPALVGQFISLFKDTALVKIIGLTELLSVAESVNGQPQFSGQGLQAETLVFACFIYWAFCYSMSRASQRLERRLGVGER